MSKYDSKMIIDDFTKIILEHLIRKLGKKNLISVIMTGSIARNQARYKYRDGNLHLESDLDLVVVVSRRAFFKSMILIKRLEDKLTHELSKRGLLSNVSLSIITRESLIKSEPKIFFQDLSFNGKVVFGEKFPDLTTNYHASDVPLQDLYRLLFNRMIETIDGLASSGFMIRSVATIDYDLALKSMEKFTFALIQALLIKQGHLIFNISNLKDVIARDSQESADVLNKLLAIHNSLMQARNDVKNCSKDIISRYLDVAIANFKTTLGTITNTRDVSAISVQKLFGNEELVLKLNTSARIFFQYFGIREVTDLIDTIVFVLRFGSDNVYAQLYNLFLNSSIFTSPHAENAQDIHQQPDSSYSNVEVIHSRNIWLRSFHKYFKIWKLIVG